MAPSSRLKSTWLAPPHAQLGLWVQHDTGPCQQGGVNAQVLQQHAQRKHSEVAPRLRRPAGLFQFVCDPQHGLRAQAHAFGVAGTARGVGDLGGAFRQGHRRQRWPRPEAVLVDETQPPEQALPGGRAEHQAGAALLQAMLQLGWAEEGGHRHAGAPRDQRGQVPQQQFGTVIQPQHQHTGLTLAQGLGTL